MSMSGMKENRSGQIWQLAHLNDKFKWGNAVWHPKGISPCICEAAGCGGACAADTENKEDRMKIVIPKTADNLSPTITTRQNNVGAGNLVSVGHYPMGGVIYISKCE